MVKKFLKGLPRHKYIQIVASLEQVLDLNPTGFEDIVGRFKAYEERVGEETQKEDQGKLMFSNNEEHSQRGYENSCGRGRGRNGRGRGQGMSHNQNFASHTEDNNSKKNRSKLICWRCDKLGHYATVYPEKTKKNQETNLNETEEADALYVHEVVFLNEDKVIPKNLDIDKGNASVWYLDNGASNHTTGTRSSFREGVWLPLCARLERRMHSKTYYILDLKHNILSLGQATENGCDVNMKDVYLTLTDSHGRLLVRVTISGHKCYMEVACSARTYKLWSDEQHGKEGDGRRNVVYMWLMLLKEKFEVFNRFKRFKESVEKQTGSTIKTFRTDRGGEFTSAEFNLFCEENGVKRHLTAPYTPQQNSVVERRNRTLMGMTRSMLKAMKMPNYLWSEAVRHSTYLINRVPTKALENQTPYECLTSKKPNIKNLRIFGCVAHAKIIGPYLKSWMRDQRVWSILELSRVPKPIDSMIQTHGR
ncbi:PREDICTED: uncharacterized protein LOC106309046 [Brassica oleracea var. oleracea]|uniref:uncharacterized protein LOC106309046 n=1 Tax=Brassica oleracea var. oleracea TaxID=109376 RepID=UPI0006A6A7FE|nr:PREDICTED: uncharacterized protein LOC106309046 [Brassica oleracea var. oleracea]